MKFYAMVSNTDTYLDNAKKQYKIWKKSPKKYSKSVSDIIKIFNLKDENKFQTKKSPKYWAGDIHLNPKFIIVSLNPGYSKIRKIRRSSDSKGWDAYVENRKNWFTTKHFQKSPYWKKNYKLVRGMNNGPEEEMNGEYILKNVLNLNLFPYHSNESTGFPSKFTVKQLKVILDHLVLLFDLIAEKKPKYCFFNGKVWETLLIEHKLIDVKFSKKNTKFTNRKGVNFGMYFGKKGKTRYVLFNKFLSSTGRYGVRNDDFSSYIPNFIKKHS
jgi:hypothetical protein